MTAINQDLAQSEVSTPYVELFEFDGRNIHPSLYFHFTPSSDYPLQFGGKVYEPFPIQGKGWETTTGQLPRPKITISNVTKIMQPYLYQYQDLTKMKVIRTRTLGRFLDGNAGADPSQHLPLEIFYINAMTRHDRATVEFELITAFDMPNVKLPRAQALKDDLNTYSGNTIMYKSRNLYGPGLTTGRSR